MRQARSDSIKAELKRLFFFWGTSLVLGLALDQVFWAVILAVVIYYTILYREISAFYDWLDGTRTSIPEGNAVLFDVAERIYHSRQKHKKVKSRLNQQLRRVQESTKALSDGVLVTSSGDRLVWWNEAAQKILGLSKSSDRGQSLTNFIRAPHFVEYLESGDFEQPVNVSPTQREHLNLQIQVTTFGDSERLMVIRDITKVAQLEQMRKDFVGNVSHELRTPLTVLKGYIENLVLLEDMLPDPMTKALGQMSSQVERMNATVEDLMLLSKLDEQDEITLEEPIDLKGLAERVAKAAELAVDTKHKLVVEFEDCQVLGIESELYSALTNIVYNAIKYSPDGGEIKITTAIRANHAVFSVSDQGVGIDPKHIARLTERFYRADSARTRDIGGTGLGLAIVKHVLMRHQAELKIQSWPGEGSTFSCVFKLA